MPGKRKARAAATKSKASDSGPKMADHETDVDKLTTDELRTQLLEIGEDPGPIDASNKYADITSHPTR